MTVAHPAAEIVRRLADDIAANGPTRGSTQSLPEQIAHVRAVSDAAQRQLQEALRPLYPDVGWTGEEDRPTSDAYWLYDAIDGAYHYLQGLPLWASFTAAWKLATLRHWVPAWKTRLVWRMVSSRAWQRAMVRPQGFSL